MNRDAEHEEQRYFTLVEAAQTYRVSIRTLTRWAERGLVPCEMVAGEWMLAREHLEAMVARLENSDD
jgi:predicted site-specific integrase-resolvase